jgi:hypothetical protein
MEMNWYVVIVQGATRPGDCFDKTTARKLRIRPAFDAAVEASLRYGYATLLQMPGSRLAGYFQGGSVLEDYGVGLLMDAATGRRA